MGCNPITGPDSFATRHLSGCMPNSLKRSHSKLAAAFEADQNLCRRVLGDDGPNGADQSGRLARSWRSPQEQGQQGFKGRRSPHQQGQQACIQELLLLDVQVCITPCRCWWLDHSLSALQLGHDSLRQVHGPVLA